MAHTVTLLADHKGFTKPKVVGDEYVVDAYIVVTTATSGGEVITATSLGLDSITCATITGNSIPATYDVDIEVSATGAYESNSSIALLFTAMDGTNAAADGDITDATVRLRVWGNL